MKISEMIQHLTELKNMHGDIEVYHQSDPEGNGYGTITHDTIYTVGTIPSVVIHPHEEYINEDRVWGAS